MALCFAGLQSAAAQVDSSLFRSFERADTSFTFDDKTLPDLRSFKYSNLGVSASRQSLPPYQLPPVPRGFFCRFEDVMQIRWKVPINVGVGE